MDINIDSEIGKLQGVILHKPGKELERMTPETIQEALYSDILNSHIAGEEYAFFEGVLQKSARVFYVEDLLIGILKNTALKERMIDTVCGMHNAEFLKDELCSLTPEALADIFISGYEKKGDFSGSRYPIPPLYNFFFTRDASVSLHNEVLVNRMRHPVRDREAYLMDMIFQHAFNANTFRLQGDSTLHVEGGDLLVAREDVLLVGNGSRTSKSAIEALVQKAKGEKRLQYIVVQELPEKPDSFIHLDMVFTFLDKNACMCYKPIIAKESAYHTTIITIEGEKVQYTEKPTLLQALQELHFDLQPICCGDPADEWNQQREQWHSGANFFAMAPGQIIGYERNQHTIGQLAKAGFEVIPAKSVVQGKVQMDPDHRYVVTLSGSELPRGGGGARCMTMPVYREKVIW